MAVFYLLPPRAMVDERLTNLWRSLLPGVVPPPGAAREWSENLAGAAESVPGTFVVFRDELDDPRRPLAGLRDRFGAGPGDQIVEVRWDRPADQPRARVGRFPAASGSVIGTVAYTEPGVDTESISFSDADEPFF